MTVLNVALGIVLGFFILIGGCSLLYSISSETEIDESAKIAYIYVSARTENWDSDAEEDGISILIQAKDSTDSYLYIPKESKVSVKVYKKVYKELLDFEGEYKDLIKNYESDIYESTYKSYGVKVPMEKAEMDGSGKIEVTLILPNGKTYSAEDTVFLG